MKTPVILTIHSSQSYENQEPESIELVTEGVLESLGNDTWVIEYEESALTGMKGVHTAFHISPERVVLHRTGALESRMVFEENVRNEALYQMDFGALMIGICATKVCTALTAQGGSLEVAYNIQIEQSQAGSVLYRITAVPK